MPLLLDGRGGAELGRQKRALRAVNEDLAKKALRGVVLSTRVVATEASPSLEAKREAQLRWMRERGIGRVGATSR
jgi:hypothetical protein